MDFQAFVNGAKTLLIAPAGYGKTYTIVECLKYTSGKQLILTHTHAGVASIKEKIKDAGIPSSSYNIETISSFAQKYFDAFYVGLDKPKQDDKHYHSFVIEKAVTLFTTKIVQDIIKVTYDGIFIDEYQDCMRQQHELIMILANTLPAHILGDPLQGIFDFNGDLVNMNTDLTGFVMFPELTVPYRWYKDGNNKQLGDKIKEIRQLLINKTPVELDDNKQIGFYLRIINESDLFNLKSDYVKSLNAIITNKLKSDEFKSLLLIVPEYDEIQTDGKVKNKGNITDRAQLRTRIDYSKSLILLEAIDDKMFYSLARSADTLISGIGRAHKKIKRIRNDILEKFFASSNLDRWFKNEMFVSKRSDNDRINSETIQQKFTEFLEFPSSKTLCEIVLYVKNGLKIKYNRDEVLRSFIVALKNSHVDKISVYEAMGNNRNQIRRSGRKVHGKCLGTTLLTKGLEFDTVVLLNAHRFDSPEHLYVAITRCCKNLIIFTANKTLSPYRN